MKAKFTLFIISAIFISCSPTLKLKEPYKIPTENNIAVQKRIQEGVFFYDNGEYSRAINKYHEALSLNSENPVALYEISLSYFANADYEQSLSYALKASDFESGILEHIYLLIGSNLDQLGKLEDAIAAFEKGLIIAPNSYLMNYNLGITYSRYGERKKAMGCLKKAVMINPKHSSSHLALANEYFKDNYRIPCILAYSRFLILKSDTKHTRLVLNKFQHLLVEGVDKKSTRRNIVISVQDSAPVYDGKFDTIDLALAFAVGLKQNILGDDRLFEVQYDALTTVFAIMSELSEKTEYTGFVWEYYAPYFIEIHKNNMVEPFVYLIFQRDDEEKINSWIRQNQEDVSAFIEWSDNYQFLKNY